MQQAASPYRRLLATAGLVLLTAGDLFRYGITWYGWGALVLIGLVLTVVELVRARLDPRRLPFPLLAFLLLCAASTAWSHYPGATALGTIASLICAAFGVLLGGLLSIPELVAVISSASRFVLGASLLFELLVAAVIRHPVLPLWVAYCDPAAIKPACYWSRDLLFEGGRIQGVQGNANLLAIAALIGLIVFAVRFAARQGSRPANAVWAVVALLCLALTRSSTVLVAGLAVVVVAVFLVVARRMRGRARLGIHLGGLVVLVAGLAAVFALRAPLLALIGKNADLTNRTRIWSRVGELAAERPVGGWGWVSYWPNWVDFFDGLVRFKGITYYQAHDAWLDVFFQLGAIGVVVFAALVLVALVRSWRLALDAPAPPAGSARVDADPGDVAAASAPERADAVVEQEAPPASWPLALALPLVMVALVVQSLAESRLLIESEFALLVAVAVATRPRRFRLGARRAPGGVRAPAGADPAAAGRTP